MEEKYNFTKQELATAFDKWNKEHEDNPDGFDDILVNKECALQQAETLIQYLSKK